MKKIILYLCLIAAVVATCTSCSSSLNNNEQIGESGKYATVSIHADYPEYKTADEIVNGATNIYSGIIKDISFEIIDYKTGIADSSPVSDSTSRMLYTVYTVSVRESIKGENSSEIKICRMGGLKGYKEEQQYSILCSSGLIDKYNGIPMVNEECELELNIDNSYLFCTRRTVGEYDFVINLDQFATPTSSDIASLIINSVNQSK